MSCSFVPCQLKRVGKRAHGAGRIARGQIIADRAVVGRGVRERLLREREARRGRERPAARAHLLEQRGVVRRIDDDADVRMILRRRAHHRGPADVDVFDRVVERAAGLCHRLAERIKVDDDEIDGRNVVAAQRRDMRRQIASREDSAVHLGMQRLHATVEHFGKAGVGGDLGDRQPGVGQRFRGAAGGQELDAERREAAREIDQAGLVGDRQQCLGDRRSQGFGSDLDVSRATGHWLVGPVRGCLANVVLRKLGAQRVAIQAEHVRGIGLIAAGAMHDRRDAASARHWRSPCRRCRAAARRRACGSIRRAISRRCGRSRCRRSFVSFFSRCEGLLYPRSRCLRAGNVYDSRSPHAARRSKKRFDRRDLRRGIVQPVDFVSKCFASGKAAGVPTKMLACGAHARLFAVQRIVVAQMFEDDGADFLDCRRRAAMTHGRDSGESRGRSRVALAPRVRS